jgi:circadian clock protein KaiC
LTRQKRQKAKKGIEKVATGIDGFDEISGGGIPHGRTTLVVGGSGCGKTVFALQTLVHGARDLGEPGIFVAFEENSRQIVANAASFGWDVDALERGKLFFLDARLAPNVQRTGEFDLTGLLASISAKAQQMGARRIVFDSIDVMLAILDDVQAERREIYRLHDWLLQSGMTGVVTSRLEGADPSRPNRYSFMHFMADCVVALQMRVQDRVSMRDMRIMKCRGSSFAENEFPMVIGPSGIEVAGIPDAYDPIEAPTERVSTGIDRLDTMLRGGYFRGAGVLITGLPGTAKSTLAGAFAAAACRRGERTLFVGFDEPSAETVRNLASVNIQFAPHVRSGLLRMQSAYTATRSAEEHLLALRALIREHRATAVVIDPISTLLRAGGEVMAFSAAERLIQLAKREGITLLCTALTRTDGEPDEAAALPVSTLADTWLHLAYHMQGGERNRSLTIVKSRGTRHSNQVRELVLSDDGVTLSDVYTAGGEVLMGTLRWEREAAERAEKERLRAEFDRKRIELEQEIESYRAALERLSAEQHQREVHWQGDESMRLKLRDSDIPPAASERNGKEEL